MLTSRNISSRERYVSGGRMAGDVSPIIRNDVKSRGDNGSSAASDKVGAHVPY